MKTAYTYILSNRKNGTLYIGTTSDLSKRVLEHRLGIKSNFASKYKTYKLVYYEEGADMTSAIEREKQLKNWHRDWKINLIESINPEWKDLLDPETSSG
ncbi:GIY-YIG nuclease family protein [Candidatus Saccharibacteria bacterium]|nr:GIY-YIG nuclease family protein [Candidatus Saccharibacteria bacterium]